MVYGAGFGEIAQGERLEHELAEVAAHHGLPVCGPNGNGIVALHERAALWGDALRPLEPGRVGLVSQSGNVAVNTLATRRGLRLHTVVSCGNSVGLDPAEWVSALAEEEEIGSIALYLEADGDGERLCEALARCVERGVGVAVLKVGASAAGAVAAAAHTGAVAGDQRVFRALVEEAGAAWAADVHELLELAKVLAVPGARPAGARGLAVLTCSGGDSALAADECERMGLPLPPLAPATAQAAARAAPGRGHRGQPARLHRADLGRGRDAARHRRGDRQRPRRRPAARALRPTGRNRGGAGRELGRGARGHPRRRGRQPRAGRARLHPARAARRRRRGALRRSWDPAGGRIAHRARLRRGAQAAAGRSRPPARDRRGRRGAGRRLARRLAG